MNAAAPAPNPLLEPWDAPFGLPPFQAIQPEHFEPALKAAMQSHLAELQQIGAQRSPPDFENTVAAFDRSGQKLKRIEALLQTLDSSASSPALQAVMTATAAPLAAHDSAVYMNPAVFERIDFLHRNRDTFDLDAESQRLLARVHLDFVRAGALLEPNSKRRYAEIMEQLATLNTEFSQNVLHDETSWYLLLTDETDLAGLPDFLRASSGRAAIERDQPEGTHLISLARSLVIPFLSFSTRRDLRERVWKAWVGRGEHAGEHDNRPVIREILRLRSEQAALHGYGCYADYALADTMAGSRTAVSDLFDQVWPRALEAISCEEQALRRAMTEAGESGPIEPWDWLYWSEKVRQTRYALDDAEVKPYFALPAVVAAAFDTAERLFGVRFLAREDLPVYHPDVRSYAVLDATGHITGVFLQDNFTRPNKRSGAWMSALRWQHTNTPGEAASLPIILNNNNFARGAAEAPTLLSLDEAQTLFHEFGHGLHGLLSQVRYERLSGTQVLRDFVELPSQLFEHWLLEPAVLERHARHWQTGAAMPDELMQRIRAAARFNEGYETVRYMGSALVDLAVHSLQPDALPEDLSAFEAETLASYGHPRVAGVNHRLAHFQHLFADDGYAAGYYVYLWAEVLDADGYDAFTESGNPFDREIARRLLQHIYSSGDTVEPGAAYRAFRGRAPQVEPMLRKRGLIPSEAAPSKPPSPTTG